MKKLIVALLAWCVLVSVGFAAEVAGVKIADSATVGGSSLALNGAGIRTRMFIKVYVGALYLAQKADSAVVALSATGAKRVSLNLLRDLKAEQVSGALQEGLAANNSAADVAKLEGKTKEFLAIINSVGNSPKGTVIDIDHVPGAGTQVSVNGAAKGTVSGDEFYGALLKVWLGDHPVDESLKKGMLGK